MRYIHVSFDTVECFYPRIPETRCQGENDSIPRICVSGSIEASLNAIPQAGNVIENVQELGLPVILHAYYLTPEEGEILPSEVVQQYVPDAETTGEMWLMKAPKKVIRVDFEVTKALIQDCVDINGDSMKEIITFDKHRTHFQDNWEIFFNRILGERPSGVDNVCRKISYRQFMINLNDQMLSDLKMMAKLAKQYID